MIIKINAVKIAELLATAQTLDDVFGTDKNPGPLYTETNKSGENTEKDYYYTKGIEVLTKDYPKYEEMILRLYEANYDFLFKTLTNNQLNENDTRY